MQVVTLVSQPFYQSVSLFDIRAGLNLTNLFLPAVFGLPMADKICLGTAAESTHRPFVINSLCTTICCRTYHYTCEAKLKSQRFTTNTKIDIKLSDHCAIKVATQWMTVADILQTLPNGGLVKGFKQTNE
jgi:hypothetical protein